MGFRDKTGIVAGAVEKRNSYPLETSLFADSATGGAGDSAFRQAETLRIISRLRTRTDLPKEFMLMDDAPPHVAPVRRK